MKSIVLVPECFPHPWDMRPSLLHIELVHTGSSVFTRSLYTKFVLVVSQWMCFQLVTLWLYLLGGLCEHGSLILCAVLFFLTLPMGKCRCIFESGHMVDSLGS